MTTDDTNRRFWEIVDASYTPMQYSLLIYRCRDLETEIIAAAAKAEVAV